MAEWLRRQPAKLMGFARVGSNPTVVVLCFVQINLATTPAGLAQLVERWSHNPKVVSSILTPGTFAWMNSEGSGLGFQIHGDQRPSGSIPPSARFFNA